jgi:hypothetical protein
MASQFTCFEFLCSKRGIKEWRGLSENPHLANLGANTPTVTHGSDMRMQYFFCLIWHFGKTNMTSIKNYFEI